MTKKRSVKVPDNLKRLAKSGERVRYAGFWLGPSERDRAIAAWLDATPQAGAVIKAMIYAMITGSNALYQNAPPPSEEYADEIEEAGAALLDLDN